MLKIKKILFPTDFSRCAKQALSHAIHLAEKYDAELDILHATVLNIESPRRASNRSPNIEEIQQWFDETAKHNLDDLLAVLDNDIKVKTIHIKGVSTAPAILEYAEDNDVDIIVIGTHGRRGLGHIFLGSVAEELVRLAPCPVFTIREEKKPIPAHEIKKILVPIDFSDYSKSTLTYAKHFAERYNARLQLLHVISQSIPPSFYAGGVTSWFELAPDLKLKCEEQLNSLFKETQGPDIPFDIHVSEGTPAHDIVDFAKEQNPDLLVIATHGLTGIQHLLLGSVAEKVVRMSPCPVFTVKPFGRSLL